MGDQAANDIRRIAVNAGGGYAPGLQAVAAGAVMAAHQQGWEVAAIHDGYEGLLFRDRYPDGGLRTLDIGMFDRAVDMTQLGISRVNPFSVRTVTDGMVEELDRSDELLAALRDDGIDAVISVAGRQAMSIVWKLARKGLRSVCIPISAENDLAATELAFGYNSVLSIAIELLTRIRRSALADRQIVVIEVLSRQSGWPALQAGIAALADAVLIPEIPYNATRLAQHLTAGQRRPALVVVAEGAQPVTGDEATSESLENVRRALSPGSTSEGTAGGRRVIERAGAVSQSVALELQRLTRQGCFCYVLDPLLRAPTRSVP